MRIYVSGAITGYEKQTEKWRKDWLKRLEEIGFTVFDPWIHGDKARGAVGTVNEDIRRILSADILLVNGDIPSWGSAQEMIYARLFKKHIWTVFSGETLPFWVEYHSDKVFKSFDEFVVWAKHEYQKA